MDYMRALQVLWDYLGMHQQPQKAGCIVGFGNFNTNIARRAAELYHQGYAPPTRRKTSNSPGSCRNIRGCPSTSRRRPGGPSCRD